jgi:hypothetical protein
MTIFVSDVVHVMFELQYVNKKFVYFLLYLSLHMMVFYEV